MAKKPSRRITSDFTLGAEQAELDTVLDRAFFESGHFRAISNHTDKRCFLVGRTGGGKSAALQYLEETQRGHVVRIDPQDLSLVYLSNLGILRRLSELDVHLDPFFNALWKHVLLVELIRHRYKVDSMSTKQTVFATLREAVRRDKSKQQALEYFEEYEGRFWDETDVRVMEIVKSFEEQVGKEGLIRVGSESLGKAQLGGSSGMGVTWEERIELTERYQRIVNETQLPRLNQMMKVLDEDILDSKQLFTYVVIDDLDRDWVDDRLLNDLIRSLFRTVLDLQRIRHLKILVALRTNIFSQLDFGRAGGQEEKFRALVLPMRWTRAELIDLLDERARFSAQDKGVEGVRSIGDLLPQPNKTRGNALDYIIGRTLMRPRDAMAYFNECFSLAAGKPHVTWETILAAEGPYSHKRLLALRDEWKLNYPGIDRLFSLFEREHMPMNKRTFVSRLDDAMLLIADPTFPGTKWLTAMSEGMWNPGEPEWQEVYHPLTELLFRIGFLGFSRSPGDSITYAHDDMDFGARLTNLRDDSLFSIHPTFHSALEITKK